MTLSYIHCLEISTDYILFFIVFNARFWPFSYLGTHFVIYVDTGLSTKGLDVRLYIDYIIDLHEEDL